MTTTNWDLYDGHDHKLGHTVLLDGNRVLAHIVDATADEQRAIERSLRMATALEAIRAHVNGEWDDPSLASFGALGPDLREGVLRIVKEALPWS
jgi:hypothetical protein